MYPPAPEQPAASPYTPAGVTGSTPNPNYAPQPQMQQAFQQQAPGTATPPTSLSDNSFLQNVAQQQPPQPLQGTMPTPAQKYIGQNMGVAPTTEQGYARGGPVASRQANNVQQHGRGNDTMLVHMTPKEVGGLQALARAHGGSLTTNPHTGLPEAGFLESILPTLLGVGLSFIPGIGPLMAAGITGIGTTAVTGDLKQGLMAGLGAFGGASLAGGLTAAAGAGAGEAVAATLPEAITATTALPSAVAPAASLAGVTNAVPAVGGNFTTAFSDAAAQAASKAGSLMPSNLNLIGSFGNAASAIPSAGANLVDTALPALGGAAPSVAPAAPNMLGQMFGAKGQAFGKGFSEAAGENLMGTATKPSMMKTGLAAMGAGMPILEAMQPTYKPYEPEGDDWNYEGPYKPQDRKVRFMKDSKRAPGDSSEFSYFENANPYPGYVTSTGATPSGYADGGPVRFGNGGSAGNIEISDDVARGLASINTVGYAAAPENRTAVEVVRPSEGYRPGIDPEHNYKFTRAEAGPITQVAYPTSGGSDGFSGFDLNNLSDADINSAQDIAGRYGFSFGRKGGFDGGVGGGNNFADSSGSGLDSVTSGGESALTSGINPFRDPIIQAGTGTFTSPADPFNDYTGLQGSSGLDLNAFPASSGMGGLQSPTDFSAFQSPADLSAFQTPSGMDSFQASSGMGGFQAPSGMDSFQSPADFSAFQTPSGMDAAQPSGLLDTFNAISSASQQAAPADFSAFQAPSGMSSGIGALPTFSGMDNFQLPSGMDMDMGYDESPRGGREGFAVGGMTLRDGAFIVDARTVSELGNGSSGAGQELLAKYGGVPIRGPGDGVSDSIRANIGGKQEARVARDEVKFDPEAVARLGGGKASVGAKKLYALMNKAHTARKSAKRGQDTGLRGAL